MLFHCFIIILPVFFHVFLVEMLFVGFGNEWCFDFMVIQIVPIHISKPWMRFYFFSTTIPKSLNWLTLDHLVNKIGSFWAPSSWNFWSLDLNLFSQNCISNIFSSFSKVRPSSHHTFISNDSCSEVINSKRMILATHDLRSHVPGCSWSVLMIFWSQSSSNTKVCRT